MKWIFSAMFAALCIIKVDARAPEIHPREDRIIAVTNGGFIIEAGGHRIAIDALRELPLPPEAVLPHGDMPPSTYARALENARFPFNDLDLILATSAHEHQFEAGAVARYLAKHPKAQFVSSEEAANKVRRTQDGQRLSEQVRGAELLGAATIRKLSIQDITLRIFKQPDSRMAFLLDIGGKRIFHPGRVDIGSFQDAGIRGERVDVAFLPVDYLTSIVDGRLVHQKEKSLRIQEWIHPAAVVITDFKASQWTEVQELQKQLEEDNAFQQVHVFCAYRNSVPFPQRPEDEHRAGTSGKTRSHVSVTLHRRTDAMVQKVLDGFDSLNLGMVRNGKIVFLKAYGSSDLNTEGEYASVSKPVTAIILMKFLAEGKIKSLDDNIWDYSALYLNCMPDQYKHSSLTFRQIMSHRGGIAQNHGSTWKDGKLNLLSEPGTSRHYSTGGYGILGQVMEDIAGESYENLLKKYIAEPMGAISFKVGSGFGAPGGGVTSTIEDMALFTIGVMKNMYITSEALYDRMLNPTSLGWGISGGDGDNLVLSHPGNNGRPVA